MTAETHTFEALLSAADRLLRTPRAVIETALALRPADDAPADWNITELSIEHTLDEFRALGMDPRVVLAIHGTELEPRMLALMLAAGLTAAEATELLRRDACDPQALLTLAALRGDIEELPSPADVREHTRPARVAVFRQEQS